MRIGMVFAVAAAAAFLAPATSIAQEEGKQDFTLVNETGYAISEVYVSPSRASDWQEDIMGSDVLEIDSQVHITFHRREHPCHWDLKVVYQDDDSSAEWGHIDLCTVSTITIHYNRRSGETSATTE